MPSVLTIVTKSTKFGRLMIDKELPPKIYSSGQKKRLFRCICDCGKITNARLEDLKSKHKSSCGCFKIDGVKNRMTKHGLYKHPLYGVLDNMKRRCYNPKSQEYHNYGGRGIPICKKWMNAENGVSEFIAWAESNGYKTGLHINRIDNNKGYSPNNCEWVTPLVNSNNKRNNLRITYKGKTQSLSETVREHGEGISYHTVRNRINRGQPIEKALRRQTC